MPSSVRSFAMACTFAAGLSLWNGCGGSTPGSTGDAQNVTQTSPCSMKFASPAFQSEFDAANDPVKNLILRGDGCPQGLTQIDQKLARTDHQGCLAADQSSLGAVRTRLVSERSQDLGKPDRYRGVLTRECGGRSSHELFISIAGQAGAALTENVELIGQDKTRGVFNFYSNENGEWKYFGSSADFVSGGYDCDAHGACVPKAASETRCAACHAGGGLNMKEISSPWVGWEGATETPGAADFIKAHAILGAKDTGADMERQVESGDLDWLPARVEVLKAKGVAELLRPLFCTVDLELDAMEGAGSLVALPINGNGSLFLDSIWDLEEDPPMKVGAGDYPAALLANHQRIVDAKGNQLTGPHGLVTDRLFAWTIPHRSGHDASYVDAVQQKKLVDDDFVTDVAHVDFTRPIFSAARCGLLSAAPSLSPDKMTADAIREGFKVNLATRTDPASQLFLKNLNAKDDQKAHLQDVRAFTAACRARPAKDVLKDALAYTSHLRNLARGLKHATPDGPKGILEFSETLPVDDLKDDDRAFAPDCTLK